MNQMVLGVSGLALAVSVYALFGREETGVPVRAAPAVHADGRLDQIEARLDALSDEVMGISRALKAGSRMADSADREPQRRSAGSGNQPGYAQNRSAPPAADQLDSRLAALENKLRQRNPFGQWMATSEELTSTLGLNSEQSVQAKALFNEVKDETLELLSIANEEGSSPLDEMAEDFRQGMEFKPALDRLVKRMEATIPGTNETYGQRMQGIERSLFERLEGALDDSQFEQLKKANIAPTMIQTGYDPVGEYIRRSLEADAKR